MSGSFMEQAKLAEQADRYEDMMKFMDNFIKEWYEKNTKLAADERNLLSVAYKNVIGSKRSSWRTISSIEQKEEGQERANKAQKLTIIKKYKSVIEKELDDLIENILETLDKYILSKYDPENTEVEAEVFFYKMKGDYCRYMAEYKTGEDRIAVAEKASIAYNKSEAKAVGMSATHPIKLGLALNKSVFHYEILAKPEEACKLAKKTFEEAIADLDQLKDDSYKDSALIMGLLRDNLSLWTTELQGETGEEWSGDQ